MDLKSPPDAEFQMTTVTFFTPAGLVPLTMAQVQMRGYGIANTDSRLVLRGPRASAQMYSQNVSRLRLLPPLPPNRARQEHLQPIWRNNVFSFAANAHWNYVKQQSHCLFFFFFLNG